MPKAKRYTEKRFVMLTPAQGGSWSACRTITKYPYRS